MSFANKNYTLNMKKIVLLLALFAFYAVSFASVNVGLFKYDISDGNNYAGLVGPVDTSTISGDIVIPDSFVYDGETYIVTRIYYDAFNNCRNITSISIPNTVNDIDYYAFFGCSGLRSVNIPEGITALYSNVFAGCSSLDSISLPSTLRTIGLLAFNGCSSLSSITLPEGLEYIGGYAFRGCSSLTSIVLPNSVTGTDSYVFNECTGLTSAVISNSLDTVGSIFANCSSLSSVVIPEGVTAILHYAFLNTALTEVTIPASVSAVDQYAFMNCPLQKVGCLNPVPPTCHGYAFSDYSGRLFVPAGSESAYAAATGWENFNIVWPRYDLNVLASDSTVGIVFGSGMYASEENAVVMAVPIKGYAFDGWSDGVTDNPRNFSVTFDAWSLDTIITPSIEEGYSIYFDTVITAVFVPQVSDTVLVHDTIFEQVTDTIYLEYDGGSAMEYSLEDLNVYYFMGRVVNTDNIYIKLYDAGGKLLAKGTDDIDMSNLPSAVYIVTDGKGGFLKIVHDSSY